MYAICGIQAQRMRPRMVKYERRPSIECMNRKKQCPRGGNYRLLKAQSRPAAPLAASMAMTNQGHCRQKPEATKACRSKGREASPAPARKNRPRQKHPFERGAVVRCQTGNVYPGLDWLRPICKALFYVAVACQLVSIYQYLNVFYKHVKSHFPLKLP
jgi:hypothetical protein